MAENQALVIPARVSYEARPVLTTEQLARFYECKPQQIIQNFNNNKERFVEGKHYFKLEGAVLKEFKNYIDQIDLVDIHIGLRAPSLILWTKQGAARHAKMLNTEKAWEVYEELEEYYFSNEHAEETHPAKMQDNPLWIETRTHGKVTRRKETDVIKIFIEYRKAQGSKCPAVANYSTLSTLANKAAGVEKGGRNFATIHQLNVIDLVEDMIADELCNGMEANKHYKEILGDVRARVDIFVQVITCNHRLLKN